MLKLALSHYNFNPLKGKLPIVPTYNRNGTENYRKAEKTGTENVL